MLSAHPPTAAKSPRPRTAKSRVTNGSALLEGVDGRGVWARRMRDLIELHIDDLGGETNVSEAERAIVRRAAVLITELERLEAQFALGEGAPDIPHLDAYQRAAGNLRRLLEAVGLQRRSKDVTTTLDHYLAKRRAEASDAAP